MYHTSLFLISKLSSCTTEICTWSQWRSLLGCVHGPNGDHYLGMYNGPNGDQYLGVYNGSNGDHYWGVYNGPNGDHYLGVYNGPNGDHYWDVYNGPNGDHYWGVYSGPNGDHYWGMYNPVEIIDDVHLLQCRDVTEQEVSLVTRYDEPNTQYYYIQILHL